MVRWRDTLSVAVTTGAATQPAIAAGAAPDRGRECPRRGSRRGSGQASQCIHGKLVRQVPGGHGAGQASRLA